MEHKTETILTLPVAVVSRVDIGRLLREVGTLSNFLEQAAVRQPGTPVKMPKTSRFMDEIVTSNKLNILMEADRTRLTDFLTAVRDKAPVMHISFGSDPSPAFLTKLVTYLRREIHPLVLIQVGLQPNIGAGCVLRTTNKYFDFSLRQNLKKKQDVLMKSLKQSLSGPAKQAPANVTDEVLAA